MQHNSVDPDGHTLVFDLIEPLRPIVDRVVLNLVGEETFSREGFILQKNGDCRLSPELAWRVVHGAYLELNNS